MNNFYNPNTFPGMNFNNNQTMKMDEKETCGCNNDNYQGQNMNMCPKHACPTTYKTCPPIVTCSKQVIDQYHVIKQPYVHNYHTEVVHHYVTQNEFIPNYTCSEVHVNEPDNSNFPA